MEMQIVVAQFKEDLAWLKEVKVPIAIYCKDKCPGYLLEASKGCPHKWFIPNVGRESHTYLHHITNNYDNLAGVTLFTQGDPKPHLSDQFDVLRLLESAGPGITGHRLATGLHEWDEDGLLVHWGKWLDQFKNGEMKTSLTTMVRWFKFWLDVDITGLDSLAYFPGAIFAMRREVIRRNPLSFYQMLLKELQHHRNPEEAYYMERAWLYLFGEVDVDYVVMTGNGSGLRRVP